MRTYEEAVQFLAEDMYHVVMGGGYYQLDPIVAKILDVPSGQLNDDIDAAFEKIRAKAWADYEARQAAK